MRLAVLSDIHANKPALEATLEEASREKPDLYLCLGDLVGYNAEPSACVSMIRERMDIVIAGNHDYDIARNTESIGTNKAARQVQQWTRAALSAAELAYLDSLPRRWVEPGRFVAVHGCYLNEGHVTGYVTSTMLSANIKAIMAHADWPRIGFCGHTHAPICAWLEGSREVQADTAGRVRWPSSALGVLLNPGSVGQPRDGDPRASFALVDLEARTFEVRRVSYDIKRAAQAIFNEGLPESLAARLYEGR
jgi:predicted phosphodiesterase